MERIRIPKIRLRKGPAVGHLANLAVMTQTVQMVEGDWPRIIVIALHIAGFVLMPSPGAIKEEKQ